MLKISPDSGTDDIALTKRVFTRTDTDTFTLEELANTPSLKRLWNIAQCLKTRNPFFELSDNTVGKRTYIVTYESEQVLAIVENNLQTFGAQVTRGATPFTLFITVEGDETELHMFDTLYMGQRTRPVVAEVLDNQG